MAFAALPVRAFLLPATLLLVLLHQAAPGLRMGGGELHGPSGSVPGWLRWGQVGWLCRAGRARFLRGFECSFQLQGALANIECLQPLAGQGQELITTEPLALQTIVINQQMADMAANARSILFGNMSAYHVRDVMAVQMFRFTDSAFTKKGQVGFLAWMRSGGNLIDANKVKAFINAAS
jgi:hypothetical protein